MLALPYKNIEDKRKQSREWQAKWRAENPEKSKATRRKWYYKNQDKIRAYSRKYSYGISTEEYDFLLEKQNNGCAICGISPENLGISLCVDHDHNTGLVRGLLCTSCNVGILNLKDDIDLLEKAKEYLKLHYVLH